VKTKSFSQLPLLPDSFSFLEGTGPSPSHPLWTVPTSLPRSQPSLVLLPMQDKTEEKLFVQRLRTPYAESDSSPPGLSWIWASPACHLWHYFFQFWPLVQTLGHGPTVGSPWSSYTPIPLKGSGSINTTTKLTLIGWNVNICVANWKEPSSFILDIFSNFSATKANKKEPKPPKIIVVSNVDDLSKVYLEFS